MSLLSLKIEVKKIVQKKNTLSSLWDFCDFSYWNGIV